MVIDHVRRELGDDAIADMLCQAGETRSAQELCDETSWNSYQQFRRLFEAAANVLGDSSMLTRAGAPHVGDSQGQLAELVQALGSPEAMYANIAAAGAAAAAIMVLRATEIQPREWVIHQSLADGFEPFEELCAFMAGAHSIGPKLFGFPDTTVEELECQRKGAPECVYRVRWEQADERIRQTGLLDTRVKMLEGRLEEFQATVADLISGDDLSTVLTRSLASASRSVQAPVFVLALNDDMVLPQRVFSKGLLPPDARRIAADLLGHTEPGDWLVVDVESTHRSYGRLAAIRTTDGFLPTERPTLQAYGRFAAAALDSAAALEKARRHGEEAQRHALEARKQGQEARRQEQEARVQGATARALLELSTQLAEITSVDEMAAKLVRAVPAVVGSDRAVIVLADAGSKNSRVAAQVGYPPDVEALLRDELFPLPTDWTGEVEVRDVDSEPFDSAARALMAKTGSVMALTIPIVVDGDWAGAIVAAVDHDKSRLSDATHAEERLRGLAAQASIAVRNARLLDQIRHQAFHDPLTGLPNRALILDRVEQMLVRARRDGRPASVMFIDLDGFKDINDTFGHATGDQVLRAVTARLQATLRQSDTIGRLGGDEFVVLGDGGSLDVGPELVAERILTVLSEPFRLDEHPAGSLSVAASIGIAIGDRPTAGELLRDADIALYQAKAAGKDCYLLFEPDMQTAAQDRLLLQMDLQKALEKNEFFLVYQPIFTLTTGDVTGVEALLRWQHPTRGEVQPDAFISLLEEIGLIVDVGRWVLAEACKQATSWQVDGLPLSIAVNVSARQLQFDCFLDDVERALSTSGLDPSRLVIEITETAIMVDMHATTRRLAALRALGIRLAIDDFGTGYSSLAYLRQFPVDILKIDRAFVSELGETSESTALIRTLVQLGKTLGLKTVAEGIEEVDQYQRLEDEDCDSGQGYLIARPLTADALQTFLASQSANRSTART